MNVITRKHLPRRTFLRGVGVSLALPLLDSMLPAQTPLSRTAAAAKRRLGCIYVPHGATMYKWTPEKDGTDFELQFGAGELAGLKAIAACQLHIR